MGPFPEAERQKLRGIIAAAHSRRQKVRFWATPDLAGPARGAVDELDPGRFGTPAEQRLVSREHSPGDAALERNERRVKGLRPAAADHFARGEVHDERVRHPILPMRVADVEVAGAVIEVAGS